jgi:hypothetical protein
VSKSDDQSILAAIVLNGNKKTLMLQKTNEKSKARKNKLIVTNQLLLKDNYLCLQCYKTKGVNFRLGKFIEISVGKAPSSAKYDLLTLIDFWYSASFWPADFTGSKFAVALSVNFLICEGISIFFKYDIEFEIRALDCVSLSHQITVRKAMDRFQHL